MPYPGTIDLGKFRVVEEEERQRPSEGADGYLLRQRAVIRRNQELVKLEQRNDYARLLRRRRLQITAWQAAVAAVIFHRLQWFLQAQPVEAASRRVGSRARRPRDGFARDLRSERQVSDQRFFRRRPTNPIYFNLNIPCSLLRAPSNGESNGGEHPLWSHAGLIPRTRNALFIDQ
jgi:hypothetical protein